MSIENLIKEITEIYDETGPLGLAQYIGTLNKDEISMLREYINGDNMSLNEEMNCDKVKGALSDLRSMLVSTKDVHMSGSRVRR